jgi:serine/threonine protein kinase
VLCQRSAGLLPRRAAASAAGRVSWARRRVLEVSDAFPARVAHRSTLSRNLVRGVLPASLGNITSLQSLLLDSNFLFGTLPPSVAALPALRNLSVADNFMVGDLPVNLSGLAALGLDKNNFTSSTLPQQLCTAACASSEAFACPFAASGCSCRPACRGKCSVTQQWAPNALVVPCGDPATACLSCMAALLSPYLLAGISAAKSSMLGFCIQEDEAKHLAAGANPAALDSLRYCQYTRPLDTGVTCPIVVPEATGLRIWTAAAANQCSPSLLIATYAPCRLCATTLQQPFLDAGCPERYDVLTACYASHMSIMLSAGITTNTLALIAGCPSTVASPPAATVSRAVLGGAIGGSLGGLLVVGLVAIAVVVMRRRRAGGESDTGPSPLPVTANALPYMGPRDLSTRSMASAPSGSLLLPPQDVVLGPLIGIGGYGKVHSARWRGSAVAAKVFTLRFDANSMDSPPLLGIAAAVDSFVRFHIKSEARTLDDERTGAAYERELLLLQSLRHPNICTLYGVVVSPPMLVMELCAGGSLAALLRASTLASLPWTRRTEIAAGVACGVDFLHSQEPPVIHRDLKSLNVVLASDGTAKLVDFGLGGFLPHIAGELASQDRPAKGTPAYMAPEVIMAIPGGTPQAIDIFGVGVVLHDLAHVGIFPTPPTTSSSSSSAEPSADTPLLFGSRDAGGKGIAAMLARYSTGYAVEIAPHCPKALGELILQCMQREPAARPAAGEVLQTMLQLSAAAADAAQRGVAWA